MTNSILAVGLALLILSFASLTEAGQPRVYRVGVIHQGGVYSAVLDGLCDGLRRLGYQESKDFLLELRDAKGDLKAVDAMARYLEQRKVDL